MPEAGRLPALLVDHVLPAVGYRQWVLSFQGPLRHPPTRCGGTCRDS